MEEQNWVKAVRKEWWHHEKNVLLIELVKHKPLLYDFSSPQYSDVPAKNSAWKEIGNVMNTSAARCKTRWEQLRSQHRKKINRIKTTDTKLRKWKYEKYMSFLLPFMKDGQTMLPLVESFNAAPDEGLTADHYDYEITAETIKVEDPRHEEMIFFENEVNKNLQERAGQNTASSTNVTEVFSEQFTKRNSKRFPSTSGVVQQTQESTSTTSAKLPINERQFMTYRTVYPTAPDPIDQFFSLMATTAKKFSAVDQHFLKSKIFNFVSSVEEKYLHQDQQNSVHIVYSTAQSSPYSGVISSEATSAMSGESIPTSFQEIQCIQLNE